METGNKRNKRGRRCREGIGGADEEDDVEKIESSRMMSKSKKLGCHHEYTNKEQGQNKVGVVGVFDFPWLKEEGDGVIFKEGVGDDDLLCEAAAGAGMGILEEDEHHYHTFALYQDSDPVHFTTNYNISTTSSLPVPQLVHHQDHPNKLVTGLQDKQQPPTSTTTATIRSSFNTKVDHSTYNIDQQQMDCIWRSVLDQPPDINLDII